MTDVCEFDHEIHGESRRRERALAEVTASQHGFVARRRLLSLGFGRGAIDHRIAIGRLLPVHRGVYAVGRANLDALGRWMAAVLACGRHSVLSHRSAAALWGLLSIWGSGIDVSVPGYRGSGRRGIVLHRVRELDPSDRALREGIPVTTVARTLLDLAEMVSPRRLTYAFEQAERLEVLDVRALRALGEAEEPPDIRSKLERRFVDFCREQNLPAPAFNASVEGATVDAPWLQRRVIVELDSFAFHRSRSAFESDRKRDAELQLAGYRVLRVTFRRLEQEPAAIAQAVRSLLGA